MDIYLGDHKKQQSQNNAVYTSHRIRIWDEIALCRLHVATLSL